MKTTDIYQTRISSNFAAPYARKQVSFLEVAAIVYKTKTGGLYLEYITPAGETKTKDLFRKAADLSAAVAVSRALIEGGLLVRVRQDGNACFYSEQTKISE